MIDVRIIKGNKSKNDKIIEIRTLGWHRITFVEFKDLFKLFCENEDTNYPNGEGKRYFIKFLLDGKYRLYSKKIKEYLNGNLKIYIKG